MRIIAGRVGGLLIKAPRGQATRPTAASVREAIFNLLEARSEPPARVLDLYAGSGALAFEALSRGAGSALAVEAEGSACSLIAENARRLGLALEVARSPVVRWLARQPTAPPAQFGWIFLDPPYDSHATGELDKALALIVKKRLAAPGGWLVAEHDWRHPPLEVAGLTPFERRRYGQSSVSFYRLDEAAR